MDCPVLYALTSSLHDEVMPSAIDEAFIKDIEKALGGRFVFRGEDFSHYGDCPGREFIYIRTGGTEGQFKRVFFSGEATPPSSVRLLTSGKSNSLAASMEIISFLRDKGIEGEILHGSPEEIARIIKEGIGNQGRQLIRKLSPKAGTILEGCRLGVVGKPSDWLISSNVDYAKAKERLDVEIIDIPMEDLLEAIPEHYPERPASLAKLNAPKYGKALNEKEMGKALGILAALEKLIERYALNGLTLRCFDLLGSTCTTGCLALAILNSRGITATCEGDVPAMLTMAVAQKLTGSSGFQANLSRLRRGGEYLFAHCTVPLDIVESYCYDTHFESGTGVAIHGEFRPGKATVVKIGAELENWFACPAEIEKNCYSDNLCRTQIIVHADGVEDYFLRSPLGNHHIIVPSDCMEAFEKAL